MSYRLTADCKPLSEDEEKAVFRKLKKGSERDKAQAMDILVRANLKLIFKIAHEFKSCPLPFDDLVAEGCTGLMHAAKKFELDKEVRFITYAAWWIRQRMRKAIEKQSRIVRVPAKANITKAKMLARMDELQNVLNRKPTVEELADYMDTSEDYVRKVLFSLGQSVSLDMPEDPEQPGMSLSDMAHVNVIENLGDVLENRDMEDALKLAWKKLSKRDQYILSMRYGMNGEAPATLEETAQEVGKCRERVRQLQEEALMTLRRELKNIKVNK